MIKISLSAMERNLPRLYKTYDDVDFNTGDVSGTAIHRLRTTINPYTGRAYIDDNFRAESIGRENDKLLEKNPNIRVGYRRKMTNGDLNEILSNGGYTGTVDDFIKAEPDQVKQITDAFNNVPKVRAALQLEDKRALWTGYFRDLLSKKNLKRIWEETPYGDNPNMPANGSLTLGTTVYTGDKPYVEVDLDGVRHALKSNMGAYTDDDILHLHHAVLSHELREAKGGLSSKYSPKNQIGSHIHPSVIQNDVRLAYRLPDIQRRNLLYQSLKDIVSTPEYALNSNARNAIEEMKDEIHDPYTPKWKKMFSSYKNNSSGDKTMWDYYRNNKNLFATNTPFDENASKYLQLGIRDATRRRMINAIDDFGRAIANKIIK